LVNKFIQPRCNRIHKNGKQVTVYLATTKTDSRESLNSTSSRVQRYSVVLTKIGKERKPQWRFIITIQKQSLEGTLVNYKDYYLDY